MINSHIYELRSPRELVIKTESLEASSLLQSQLLCRTLYSAISPGTEVAAYVGDPPLRPGPIYPRVIGYCNVAEVVAIGEFVTQYKVGDRILSFQSHRSAFISNEDRIICKIPDGVDLVEASVTYLFHLGYNALLKGGFQPGNSVAVLGLGALGLTSLAVANAFGGEAIGITGQINLEDTAHAFGAVHVFQKNQLDCSSMVKEHSNGGVDMLITTSSSWSDWRLAISSVRKEGVICVIGFPGRVQPKPTFNPLDSQYLYDSQLKIVNCGYSPDLDVEPYEIRFTQKRNCNFLLGQIIRKRLPAANLISKIVSWRGLGALYEQMASKDRNIITGVLDWTKES